MPSDLDSPPRLRVVVVDDDRFMLEVVSRLLHHDGEKYEVVAAATDVPTGVSACQQHRPDVVLLDINLPGESGIDGVSKFKNVSPRSRILLCTAEATDERIMAALRSGADGFLEKTNRWDDLTNGLQRVASGEHYFCPRSTAALVHFSQAGTRNSRQLQLKSLTDRETEVLQLVSRGHSSKEAASDLGVSVGTIDVHRANIMKKLAIKNVAGLVAFAFQTGLIS